MRLMNSIRPSPPGPSREGSPTVQVNDTPFISVVVPVRNEAKCIETTLRQLVAQRYDPRRFEILVVDGESTDGTGELAGGFMAEHPNVRVFANPRRLASAARNVGIHQSNGEIVVVVDGHCEIDDEHYLSNLAVAFARSGTDCVGRPQPLDVSDAGPVERAIAAARSCRLGHHPDSLVYSSFEGFVPAKSVAVAYRRAVFEKVGVFDESFDACEDVEFNHRVDLAGLRCYFTPLAAVHYRPRDTLSRLFVQLARYGQGRIRLMRKHHDTVSLRGLVPLLFVLGVVLGLPLCLVGAWIAMPYAATLVLYLAIVLWTSLRIAIKDRSLGLLARLPFVFVAIHLGAGLGMLLEVLRPSVRKASR